MKLMRDDVLMQLVDKAINDPDFRVQAQSNLEGTLKAHNIELTDDELAAVKEFQSQATGMSEQELDQMLAGNSVRRQGVP
jgi:hypothetical protein